MELVDHFRHSRGPHSQRVPCAMLVRSALKAIYANNNCQKNGAKPNFFQDRIVHHNQNNIDKGTCQEDH